MLWGMALAFGLVVAHQSIIESLDQQRERIDTAQLAVGQVSRDAAGLLVLTQDYLLRGSPRARRQWLALQAELANTLKSLDGPVMGLKDDIEMLVSVNAGLPPLFEALEATVAEGTASANTARLEMLSDHLLTETRRISDGAFDLAGQLLDQRSQQQRRQRSVTLGANISLATLLAALVGLVLRRVLRPMRRLQDTARRIEAGDLRARSAYGAPDEFGSLSQSFDAMTQALQERQATLEATRRDLRTVLDAVPSMIGYWDRHLNNRVANRAYHTWFGVDPDSLPGRNMRDLLGPALFEANRPFVEAALRGEPQTFERSIARPDGQGMRHSLAQYLPDRDGDEVRGFYAVVHDVTELTEGRQRLAAAQLENEALLASIQGHALFSELASDGRIVKVNDNVCRLSGYAREELVGHTYAIHQPMLPTGDFMTDVWGALKAGRAWQGEFRSVAKDGSFYWTSAVMAPVKSADGTVQKYVSIRSDVTAQRRLALEVERTNERFELAASAGGIGVWDYDLLAGTLLWDDRMYGLYGRQRANAAEPYALWSSSVHPEDRPGSEQLLQDAIAGKAAFDEQFRIVRPDGEVRHLKAVARVVRDGAGRPTRMIGINTDVTERMHTEAALRANESLLRRVGRLAMVGGWRVDVRASKVYWSEQTRVIHEAPADYEPTLETAIEFYAPESRTAITEAVNRGVSHGEGWDLELRLITYAGRSIWVRAMGEVEFDSTGTPVQIVGAFQDVTERRRTDDLLRAATTAAEAASAAKSAFLANMSHEIRTPLNAIIGVTHLLAETAHDDQQQRLLGQAQIAGRSLLGIVNDVLDLAKIEAGEMALDETAYEPAALLSDLTTVYAPQAQVKGLAFVVDVAASVPHWLIGDRGRLQQMLTNLVANALKFTERGEVRLRLGVTDLGECRCQLTATVQDTGIGIPVDMQPHLFAPFVQADASTTRRYGGSGLGLSIVKRLSAIMGGEVGLRSQPGVGSEFWVAVPQRVPAEDELGALRGAAPTLEVLVVDDSSVDRLQLATQVRALGWQALALDSGQALVQEFEQRLAAGRLLPDALLVDWRMPGVDGLQALSLLTQQFGRERLPAALLVSASERRQVAAVDHAHLADVILTKPVAASALFNAVNQSLAQRLGTTDRVLQSTQLDAPDATWLAGVRVLLVDDSDINLDVARRLLERRGAQVFACSHAQAALDALREAPEAFDAVLMDVQMPGIDGLEATRRVRHELGLTDLPVIALTAGALMEERRRATEAGMNEFLTKPLDPVQLVRTLRRVVEARRGAVLPVGSPLPAPGPRADWPHIAGIDSVDVAARLGHDVALFRVMLARLLREFGDLSESLRAADDDAAAHRALLARMHKLRGSAGMLGAREVQRLAGDAEAALSVSPAAGRAVLPALVQALAQLAQASESALQARPAAAEEPSAAAPAGHEELAALVDLLRRRDLAARDVLHALAPGLRGRLGAGSTEQLLRSVDELDYERALVLLSSVTGAPAVAPQGGTAAT